jgi:hypothetical protein
LSPTRRPKESVGSAIGWQKPNGRRVRQIAIHGLRQNPDNKGDLQAITHFEKTHLDDINFEANPASHATDREGLQRQLGHNLAGFAFRLQSEFGRLLIVCVTFDVCVSFAMMELSAAHFLFFFFLIPEIDLLLLSKEPNGRYQLQKRIRLSIFKRPKQAVEQTGTYCERNQLPIENHYRTPTSLRIHALSENDR